MALARIVTRGVSLAAVALSSGCDTETQACTAMGCGYSFEVAFSPAIAAPADYQFDVTADGVAASCTVTLPFASCSVGPTCVPAQPGFYLELSGCALPASEHEIPGLFWAEAGPASVTVSVSRDGTEVATATYTPSYSSSQPNGPGCEPTCTQAPAVTLAVP